MTVKFTQEQLQELAELRMAHDSALGAGYDVPAIQDYQNKCASYGMTILDAEALTWPVIAQEIYGVAA